MQIGTILFPTDFSACANNALEHAVQIAGMMHSKIVIVHTFPPFYQGGISDSEWEADHKARIKEGKQKLADLRLDILSRNPLLNVTTVLREGKHIKPVIDLIEAEDADLVIMGTKGASGLQQFLFGSYSSRVIEEAKCPVLAIPEKSDYNGLRKIVYASDLGHIDITAIKELVELASFFKSEVTILNISSDENHFSEEDLYRFEYKVRNETGYPKLDFMYARGREVNETIQEHCERNGADLLVMTTMKRSFFGKLLKPSQTENMSYQTHIPLLAFHETDKCCQTVKQI